MSDDDTVILTDEEKEKIMKNDEPAQGEGDDQKKTQDD